MDGYRKTGFQKFRETKASPFAGMLLALLISLGLVVIGFVDVLGGLCIGILSFFILRLFAASKIKYMMSYAAILFVSSALLIYAPLVLGTSETDDAAALLVNVFAVVLPFTLLALITWWMRQRIEKVRERLEKEGRLYPPGYGRCKRCSAVVLPGEICCRRCGEYIDVPEELRVKKVNYFECSECGREVPEDASICPHCGESFDDETDQS